MSLINFRNFGPKFGTRNTGKSIKGSKYSINSLKLKKTSSHKIGSFSRLPGRPVTRGAHGERSPPRKFFAPPPEKCVGHNFKILEIVQRFWAPLGKLFAPPVVPSWLRACSQGIVVVVRMIKLQDHFLLTRRTKLVWVKQDLYSLQASGKSHDVHFSSTSHPRG